MRNGEFLGYRGADKFRGPGVGRVGLASGGLGVVGAGLGAGGAGPGRGARLGGGGGGSGGGGCGAGWRIGGVRAGFGVVGAESGVTGTVRSNLLAIPAPLHGTPASIGCPRCVEGDHVTVIRRTFFHSIRIARTQQLNGLASNGRKNMSNGLDGAARPGGAASKAGRDIRHRRIEIDDIDIRAVDLAVSARCLCQPKDGTAEPNRVFDVTFLSGRYLGTPVFAEPIGESGWNGGATGLQHAARVHKIKSSGSRVKPRVHVVGVAVPLSGACAAGHRMPPAAARRIASLTSRCCHSMRCARSKPRRHSPQLSERDGRRYRTCSWPAGHRPTHGASSVATSPSWVRRPMYPSSLAARTQDGPCPARAPASACATSCKST